MIFICKYRIRYTKHVFVSLQKVLYLFFYLPVCACLVRTHVVHAKCQYCLVRMSGKKRSYEIAFKLKVVEFAEKENNRAAG